LTIESRRTGDRRFVDLPDFPFVPHYLDTLQGFEGLRLHFVNENPGARLTFLCLHGQPTWSYLYRRMIPIFTAAGHRVVAPDFFGFGRSDKPIDDAVYTFEFHRNTLMQFVMALDLKNIVMVCQDWGGILGLTLPMDIPDRFAGLLVMNTFFGTGGPLPQSFFDWRSYSNRTPDMNVGRLLKRACKHLTDAEVGAYNAPFPDVHFKAGVRRFPNLVPVSPEDPGAAISRRGAEWFKTKWSGESLAAIGLQDPVLSPALVGDLAAGIRGCPPPLEVPEAGHFVQEWGEKIARAGLEKLAS
jgi:haloalkane dehalogenase